MAGVQNKLIDEAKAMKAKGIDIYVLNREKDCNEDNIYFKKVDKYFSDKYSFELYLRAFKMRVIEEIIDLNSYDKIYLRYPLLDFSSLSYAKKYGHKTITQHHTKELNEILKYKINPLFKGMQYLLEKFLAPSFFTHISGLTAMSDDVIEYEVKRTEFKGKIFRFSNGIDSSRYTASPIYSDLKKSLNMIFIASNFSSWHGLDRLLSSLSNYGGATDIKLYIVVNLDKKHSNMINSIEFNSNAKIMQCGKLYGKELDKIYKNIDLACDSLAMHRLEMKESSTLKSKEYIARGIPYLYSAFDMDMIEIKEYLFDVGYSEAEIEFEKIIDFYSELDKQEMQHKFKKCAENTLDWKNKVNSLVEFINKDVSCR